MLGGEAASGAAGGKAAAFSAAWASKRLMSANKVKSIPKAEEKGQAPRYLRASCPFHALLTTRCRAESIRAYVRTLRGHSTWYSLDYHAAGRRC